MADPQTGAGIGGVRGSSQSLMQRFLPEIDPAWGRESYAAFRRHFAGTLLGIPGVREYPRGVHGAPDVDTGPLIAGFAAPATLVTLAGARVNGDWELAGGLSGVIEALGAPIPWHGGKRYAYGAVPLGDAFVVWAKNARPWVAPAAAGAQPTLLGRWWRLPAHLLSLLALLALWRLAFGAGAGYAHSVVSLTLRRQQAGGF